MHSVSQPGRDSYRFGPDSDLAHDRMLTNNSEASSIVHIGGFSPFQRFSEDAQPQVGYHLCDSSGSASHVAPPILAQCPCTIPHLAPGMPSLLGDPMLIQSCGSLEGPVHVSDQENGDYTPKWSRKYGLSTGGQRWTSLPQKTTLTAQFISQRSEMLWPTICQVLVCMPSLWLPCSLRSPLPSKRHDFAAPARPVEPSCLVPQWESWQLPMRVTNTILEARVPSMRHIYAIMWSLFSDLCSVQNKDPSSCEVSSILTFLRELLDKGHNFSMLRVYVAAIAVNHTLVAGQSVSNNYLIVKFGDWICFILILCRPGTYPQSSGPFEVLPLSCSSQPTYSICCLRPPSKWL